MSTDRRSQADAKANAEARFAKAQARVRQVEERISEQAKAAAQLTAKTEHLRALRLARDAEAAARLAGEPIAKPRRSRKPATA